MPSGVSYVHGEPGRRQAGVPRGVRPPEHRARRRLHRRAEQAARCRWPPTGVARPVDRRAHAGHLQLGLLRALVPRPADGRHARRGRRPRRHGRRPRVHAHDRRPRAGRRRLPPHRRPVPRPRGVPARLDARRARADAGVEGRQRRHRQRPGRRRRRRQGGLRLGARLHPLLPRRGAADPERADVPLPVRRRAALRARQPARPRAQAGQRERRLRHPHRQPGDRRPARGSRPRRSRPTLATGSPSRSCSCRRRRRCAATPSSRATSTCARSSSPARRATSRPAG